MSSLNEYGIIPHNEQYKSVEPEPVAWMVYTKDGQSAFVTDNPNDLVGAYRALPLYTAPPHRQPLTPAQEHAEELLEVLTELANSLPSAEYMRQQGQEEGPLLRKMRAVIAKATGENK